jgi:hypothetical protein
VAAAVVFAIYGGMALVVDFPTAAEGFHADEATYFLMGHSLARDGDLEYRAEDLARGYAEFGPDAEGRPRGPTGVFLKRGVDVTGVSLSSAPPFVAVHGVPDPDPTRLYYGKALIYPLVASPFVRAFGTNGFLLLNALLIAAAFLASYAFISARSGTVVSLLLASAFTFATVVPVYAVWVAPELFNYAVGLLAYFLWLYKGVASHTPARGWAWLRRPWTDVLAAAVIGALTFSKVSNALLGAPLGLWLLWRRQWGRAAAVAAAWLVVTAVLFGANVATSGELNYQGGIDRRTCGGPYPFSQPGVGLEACAERARNEALTNVIFDREFFWTNLRANLVYFVVGRNGGLIAYFFPAVFAVLAFLLAGRRRASWQWFVLGGLVAQALLFVITQPYTFIGSGGSVGNRYFMGAYGLAVFLLPPIQSIAVSLVPWIAGALFTAPLVLHPFEHSIRPATRVKSGPFRLLPLELTNINDLPMMTEGHRVRIWYGDDGTHPGFQIYYLDDHSYLQEADKLSFWTRGRSRADVLMKADKPFERLQITLTAGATRTTTTVTVGGRTASLALEPRTSGTVSLALGPGFPYKGDRTDPAYVWVLSITADTGFVPAAVEGSPDTRYLGVRVKPVVLQ